MNKITLEGADALEFLQYKKANLERLVKETEATIQSLSGLPSINMKAKDIKLSKPSNKVKAKKSKREPWMQLQPLIIQEIQKSSKGLSVIELTKKLSNEPGVEQYRGLNFVIYNNLKAMLLNNTLLRRNEQGKYIYFLKSNITSQIPQALPSLVDMGILQYNPSATRFRQRMFGNVKKSVLKEINNSNIPISKFDITERIINNNKFVSKKHRAKLKHSIAVAMDLVIEQGLVESIKENNTEYFCIK